MVLQELAAVKPTVIIGFAFGHRFMMNGNRTSNEVNERLAQMVEKCFRACGNNPAPAVYTQWEIAEHLPKGIPYRVVYPKPDIVKDEVQYVGTVSVMQVVVEEHPEWKDGNEHVSLPKKLPQSEVPKIGGIPLPVDAISHSDCQ